MRQVESGTIVANEQRRQGARSGQTNFDARALLLRSELPSIRDQVAQQIVYQSLIAMYLQIWLNDDVDLAARFVLMQLADDCFSYRTRVHDLTMQGMPRDTRQDQQSVDQFRHLFHAALDAA